MSAPVVTQQVKNWQTFTDKTSLRSAILEERAMELALEGDRRWDLIRWGNLFAGNECSRRNG